MKSYWKSFPPTHGASHLDVVRSLYADAPSFILGMSVSIVGCGLTAYKTGIGAIWIVCGVMTALSVVRLLSMLLFSRANHGSEVNVLFWERLYVVLGTIHVASVGSWSTVVFWHTEDALSEMMSIACSVGFLIGIQGRNFSSPTMVRLQIIAAAIPIELAFLVKGTPWYLVCGVFFALFLISVLRTSSRMCETFGQAIRTARENEELAYKDVLTDLPNRAAMQKLLADAVRDTGQPFALHFLDLDRFKRINDMLGHAAGDRLLNEAATRFRSIIKNGDTISRYAGDEFVILQRDVSERAEIADLTSRLIAAAGEPFDLGPTTAQIGCSIGTALFPRDADSAELLTQRADTALYHAKNDGRGRSAFFTAQMGEKEARRLEIEAELRIALDEDRLSLAFQPIIQSDTLRVVACEALVRWQHPVRGDIPPIAFLPIAEEAGLMGRITDATVRMACRAAAGWPTSVSVAVNLSPSQFHRADLVDVIKAEILAAELTPDRFEIEITENLSLEFETEIMARLIELKDFGIRLSLDDFGTGFSNLGYIARLPIDKIKIDKSFLRDVEKDERRMALLRGMVRFISLLDLCVVVEGVETARQLELLVNEPHVSQLQGFIFGYPLPERGIREFLQAVQIAESDLAYRAHQERARSASLSE